MSKERRKPKPPWGSPVRIRTKTVQLVEKINTTGESFNQKLYKICKEYADWKGIEI
jgi:hypothetical protein